MARLEAEVTANIGPFERALSRASHEAQEFAEKTKDVGKDVFKETAGGKAFNLMGLAGGAAAVTAFGAAIVDGLKESLGAFGKKETEQIQLKYNLPKPADAAEAHEFIEGLATAEGDVGDLQKAFISLAATGNQSFEQIKEALTDFYAISKQTGVPVSEIADALRKAAAGGTDAVDGVNRLIKTVPRLGAELERQKDIWAVNAPQYPETPGGLRYPEEVARRRALPLTDFLKESGADVKAILSSMHEMAPTGILTETKGSLEGAEGRLSIVLDELSASLGEGLAPAIKQLVNDLSANLPIIETNLKEFGTEIGNAVNFIKNITTPSEGLKKWGEEEEEWENKIFKGLGYMLSGNAAALVNGGTQSTNDKLVGHAQESVEKQETTNEYLKRIDDGIRQALGTQ